MAHSYARNYLTRVRALFEFGEPWTQIDTTLPCEVDAALTEVLPLVEVRNARENRVVLTIEENRQALEHAVAAPHKTWFFRNESRSDVLELSRDRLVFSTSNYTTNAAFAETVDMAVRSIAHAFPGASFRRVSLRAVNELTIDTGGDRASWSEYVNPQLSAALLFPRPEESALLRGMGVLEYDLGGWRLRMQYGLPNTAYPGPLVEDLFVLDLDASVDGMTTIAEAVPTLVDLIDRETELFELSITDRLRALMDGDL